MGKQKLLLPFGGGAVLDLALEHFLSSRIDEAVIVVGTDEAVNQRIREIVSFYSSSSLIVKIVKNNQPQNGQASSLKIGVTHTMAMASGFLFFLGDMPLFSVKGLNRLIDEFEKKPSGIIVPVYGGKRGNPTIFSSRFRNDFLRQEGDFGGRRILEKNKMSVYSVPMKNESLFMDLDTKDDYLRLIETFEQKCSSLLKENLLRLSSTCISIAGGGGKTSLMLFLSGLLKSEGPVMMTTTTKLLSPEIFNYGSEVEIVKERGERPLPEEEAEKGDRILWLGKSTDDGRKCRGPGLEIIGEVFKSGEFKTVLLEADGSDGRPVKVHGDGEPVIPPYVNVSISVIGMTALSRECNSEIIHRYPEFERLFPRHEKIINIDQILKIINHPEGLFSGVPEGVFRILFCNQWDVITEEDRPWIRRALIAGVKSADLLVLSDLKENGRIIETMKVSDNNQTVHSECL
ncbi:MAG: putative selenium-dependent hydroxylase accessory protein YqeC [Spirochaetales bacterium]|nr:putative selenium-dependent hydroxylase accessory protein YqeC [Spirochaetales bacterium]